MAVSIGAYAVEHNQQLIRHADYTINLGPEGGEKGGFLIKG